MQDVCVLPGLASVMSYSGAVPPSLSDSTTVPLLTRLSSLSAWLVNAENDDRKRVRSYAMQPPTIPHKTDNYQVDKNANRCMTCHARTRVGETQATPISLTHYIDRDGNFLADVSPRRYFCEQCHVVQMDGASPAVKNRFRDVETMIRKNKK